MNIYTSYYANMKNIPDNIIPISIAGRAPEWYNGLEYKKLAPKIGFFTKWKTEGLSDDWYKIHYYDEVLNLLNVGDVVSDLERLSDGKDVVLLCYEKPESFCHRHLVAIWLSTNINKPIYELSNNK